MRLLSEIPRQWPTAAADPGATAIRSNPWRRAVRAVLTYAELGQRVTLAAAALRQLGVRKGDRVAGYLPNCPETVIAFLASASLGAIWSSCPPELSSKGVLERLIQIEPKVLFAVSGYRYGGKVHHRRSALAEIVTGLPSLQRVVHVSGPDAESTDFLPPRLAVDWRNFPASAERGSAAGPLEFETVEFEDPLWILYSSGTTGMPCMPVRFWNDPDGSRSPIRAPCNISWSWQRGCRRSARDSVSASWEKCQ